LLISLDGFTLQEVLGLNNKNNLIATVLGEMNDDRRDDGCQPLVELWVHAERAMGRLCTMSSGDTTSRLGRERS